MKIFILAFVGLVTNNLVWCMEAELKPLSFKDIAQAITLLEELKSKSKSQNNACDEAINNLCAMIRIAKAKEMVALEELQSGMEDLKKTQQELRKDATTMKKEFTTEFTVAIASIRNRLQNTKVADSKRETNYNLPVSLETFKQLLLIPEAEKGRFA